VQLSDALQPLIQLLGSFLLGVIAAAALRLYAFTTRARGPVLTIGIICCCVLLYAYALPLGLSPLLSALFFGLVVRGTDRTHGLLSHQTSETGVVISLAYFIVLGASLAWLDSWMIAAMAAAVVAVRALAKVAANAMLAVPSALSPLKGVMVGVALKAAEQLAAVGFRDERRALGARHLGERAIDEAATQPGLKHAAEIGAAVVLITAILGPVLTEVALRWSGEPTTRREP